MNEPAFKQRMTAAEYLAFERAAETKHEFVRGEIFALSGALRAHNLIVGNIVAALNGALRERPCEVYPSDMRVRDAESERYVYPDASVVCAEPLFDDDDIEDTLLNPSVVIEVLSKSTEAYDRGDKFAMYRSIASVTEYLLLSQTEPKIELYTRQADGSWRFEALGIGDRAKLGSCGCELAVADAYLKVFADP